MVATSVATLILSLKESIINVPISKISINQINYRKQNPINLNDEILEIDDALKFFENKKINSLSGIGNPKYFTKILETLNIKMSQNFIFPDHYWFNIKDIEKSLNFCDILLTTEKDFVKIKDLKLNFETKSKIFFVNMDINFDEFSYEILSQKLLNLKFL